MAFKDPEEKKAYNKAYYERNRERLLSQSKSNGKKYYEKNKKEITAREKSYREANKEKIADRKKNYFKKNKESFSSRLATRRARKLNQTPDLNIAEKVEIQCMYLYNQIMPGDWHVDHIVALANGGLHHPANLQILSKFDNLSKGAR